jgi:major type 1 subunit fimbrin (pilin)
MNKLLLTSALAVAFGAAALAPQAARAATNNPVSNNGTDGTITITGKVIAQTCKVDGNSAGTPDAISVQLPDVLTSQLASSGQVTGAKPFSIEVTGCDSALTSVQTYFSGSNIDQNTGRLTNQGSAGAVDVQLLNSNSQPMTLNGADATAQGSLPVNLDANGAATLKYSAQYYATGQSSAGDVNTSVAFTMVYQ